MVGRGTKLAAGTNAQQQASPRLAKLHAPNPRAPRRRAAEKVEKVGFLISIFGILEAAKTLASSLTVERLRAATIPFTQTTLPITVTAPLGDSSRVPSNEHRVAASNDADMNLHSLLLLWISRGSLHLIGLIRYNRE